jgi:hypothetical protein
VCQGVRRSGLRHPILTICIQRRVGSAGWHRCRLGLNRSRRCGLGCDRGCGSWRRGARDRQRSGLGRGRTGSTRGRDLRAARNLAARDTPIERDLPGREICEDTLADTQTLQRLRICHHELESFPGGSDLGCNFATSLVKGRNAAARRRRAGVWPLGRRRNCRKKQKCQRSEYRSPFHKSSVASPFLKSIRS